jgi:hypothetical protein
MSKEREFIVTAHFEKRSIRLGTYTAERPVDAIKLAREKEGFFAASTLNCEERQLTWEVEEDFL